jgi:hypothetical protein
MTPLPHADESAAEISGDLSGVAAERELASGIPPAVETGHDDCRPGPPAEPPRRRRADISGSTSSCSPTRPKSTLAFLVTRGRVELRGPSLPQRSVVDGPTEAARDGFETGGAGFRSLASIGVVAGSNGDGPEREVTLELIERIASGVQGACLRSQGAAWNALDARGGRGALQEDRR